MKATSSIRFVLYVSLAATTMLAQSADDIKVTLGKSVVIDYPEDIARISTSSPEVVDAVPATTREILLHGKGIGAASVIVWSKSGQRSFYNVNVEPNLEPLKRLIRDTFPNEEIHVMVARDSLSLGGRVSSQTVSDRVAVLAAPLAKSVVNNLMVAPPGVDRQIILRVKFAELNRSYAQSFGVNLLSTGGLNTLGRTTTQQFAAPTGSNLRSTIPGRNEGFASEFNITDMLNIFMFRPDLNLGALVKALQTQGILQILAEPNLVTTNGKEASFHVGGEFPVPVLQGGGNAGAVTIMFREFGIRLNFHPIITANKTIKMHVRPEVSTIDLANAVTFNGFTIPALSTRKIETDVELGEGQSFVIGGLLDDRVTDTFNKIPGLSSIPILGALFKSRAETKTKTELVVLVTPEITTPLQPNDPKPMPAFPREFVPNSTPNTAGPVSKAVMPKK